MSSLEAILATHFPIHREIWSEARSWKWEGVLWMRGGGYIYNTRGRDCGANPISETGWGSEFGFGIKRKHRKIILR